MAELRQGTSYVSTADDAAIADAEAQAAGANTAAARANSAADRVEASEDDAHNHAQATAPFVGLADGLTYAKGAKGYAEDIEARFDALVLFADEDEWTVTLTLGDAALVSEGVDEDGFEYVEITFPD